MATIKSIEEKARRYDEAIETARKINSGEGVAAPPDWTICEVIFPELKESEDERIRKEMIEIIKNEAHEFPSSIIAEKSKSWIAWLKKQGEKKSLDDIAKEVTKDKDAAISFLKSTGIMNENGELADEYKIEQSEWSEEDKKHLNRAINILNASKTYTTSPEKYEETINWLKFLKERYTWKPSNEQMNALSVAVKHGQTDDPDTLKKLLEQLKKHYL